MTAIYLLLFVVYVVLPDFDDNTFQQVVYVIGLFGTIYPMYIDKLIISALKKYIRAE